MTTKTPTNGNKTLTNENPQISPEVLTLPVHTPKRLILCTKCEGTGLCRRVQPNCQTPPPQPGTGVPVMLESEAPVICTRDSILSKLPQVLDESLKIRLAAATERRRSEAVLTQFIALGALVLAAVLVVGWLYHNHGLVQALAAHERLASAKNSPAQPGAASALPAAGPAAVELALAENHARAQTAANPSAAPLKPGIPPLLIERGDEPLSGLPERKPLPSAAASAKNTKENEVTELLEPAASWWLRWDFTNLEAHAKAEMHDSFDGNQFVLETHPPRLDQALLLNATLLVPENRPVLEFAVRGCEGGEFNLIAEVEGRRLLAQTVRGKAWQVFALDLTPLKRKEVAVALQHAPSVWEKAGAYWQAPVFVTRAANGDIVAPYESAPATIEDPAALAELLDKLNVKTKPAKFADVKLEYERTLAETYALLSSQGRAAALARLEQAVADVQLAPVRKKLARDVECLRYLAAVDEAGLAGAARLPDHPGFNLRWSDGKQLRIGPATSSVFTAVEGENLVITQTLPSGQALLKAPFGKLAPQVRYELASLGLPETPEGRLKLAVAGLALWWSGGGEVSPKEIRANLALAAKAPAQAEMAAHVAGILEFLEQELAADARFRLIRQTLTEQKWPEARALIDSFKTDYLNTYPLACLEKQLEACRAQIPRATLGILK